MPNVAAQARQWIGRSLGRRFVALSLGLLLVIQLASFVVIDASMRRHAYNAVPQQLGMGARTLQSLVGWRSEKLIESVRLLAADYGFRSAVLSRDRETIASVLANHGARVGASNVALLDVHLDVIALADGAAWNASHVQASVMRLASDIGPLGGATEITVIDGRPRQAVLVPIKAPTLVAWVLMCFPLPEEVVDRVHDLSAVELTVLSRERPGLPWAVSSGHLDAADAAVLARASWANDRGRRGDETPPAPRDVAPVTTLQVSSGELGVQALWLTPPGDTAASPPQVVALVSKSLTEALRPPRGLQVALLVTTLLGIVAFALGSAYAARRVTTPLKSLAGAAERLGAGDDKTPIAGSGSDEVGELAQAFERMRVNMAIKQEQILQSERHASIGQLAAGVAHEINNPIAFISSNFGSLEEYLSRLFKMLAAYQEEEAGLAGTPAAARLGRLRESFDLEFLLQDIPALMSESRDGFKRVRKIVQDLKDFSHVDTRQEWEMADLHAGIESTLNIVNNDVKYKADVVRHYGRLPLVRCLPYELNQVIMNLLTNATQAIAAERGTITLRTGTADEKGTDWAWFEVEDDGCGIPQENVKRIFDPFFTTKPVGKGTGLGLSLSYGIVQKHGGRMEVHSEPGEGTRFRVTLPVNSAAEAVAA